MRENGEPPNREPEHAAPVDLLAVVFRPPQIEIVVDDFPADDLLGDFGRGEERSEFDRVPNDGILSDFRQRIHFLA